MNIIDTYEYLENFENWVDWIDHHAVRVTKRYIRDAENPFEM